MAVAHEPYSPSRAELQARFVPALVELVRAGLLERDDRGRFVLVATAQGWLESEAATQRRRPAVEARVAVGLRCQQCGDSGLTTMTDGRRLCSACKAGDGYVDEPLPELRPRRRA